MGRKARMKKQRRKEEKDLEKTSFRMKSEPVLVKIIQWSLFATLLTPLIVSKNFYFPFVGPKSLYFMGLAQIIFFSWLLLILKYKQYRPTLNSILIALSLFLIVMILSSVLGVDFSRSFWSKFERMTGLLMWFHLFGFFLAISSTFQHISQWRKIFYVSFSVAFFLSVMAILEELGVKAVNFSPKKGATIGNTSFLGTYLLFNFFLGVWLIIANTKKLKTGSIDLLTQFLLVIGSGIMLGAMYIAGARAALISTLGGSILILLLWLSLKAPKPTLRMIGKIILLISVPAILTTLVTLLFLPQSFIGQKFTEMTSFARYANWGMALKGFLRRPLLGWGPENYPLVFGKHFNPCLFTGRCGGEIWFDRSHNIIFDTLVTLGALGLLVYLAIFITVFYVLFKRAFPETNNSQKMNFWDFAVITSLLSAYFVQNLTVFDMINSLMMFMLVLGFVAATIKKKEPQEKPIFSPFNPWAVLVIFLLWLVSFFFFVWQPLRTDALVIKALRTREPQKRIEIYRQALETSPVGKYQIREFFSQFSENIILQAIQKHRKELDPKIVRQELDFVIEQLKKTDQESPLDLRNTVRLASLYNLYAQIDENKIKEAERYSQKVISLSPNNQQGYWLLAQTRVFQKKFDEALKLAEKAVVLEPNLLRSHQIAYQVAKIGGKEKQAEIIKKWALELHPEWQESF